MVRARWPPQPPHLVRVRVRVKVRVGVKVRVRVKVRVGVKVRVKVRVGVRARVGVRVGVRVSVRARVRIRVLRTWLMAPAPMAVMHMRRPSRAKLEIAPASTLASVRELSKESKQVGTLCAQVCASVRK